MSALVEQAKAALAANHQATANYHFSTAGLLPDKRILAHVKRELASQSIEIDDGPYLDLLRTGKQRYEAARELGIPGVAVYRRLQLDQEFALRVKIAEVESLETVVNKLRSLAEDGDIRAITKLLETKHAEEFGQPKSIQELNIKITHEIDNNNPVDARIRQLEHDVRAQQQARQLNAGELIDIPEEDTEEIDE